MRKVIVSVIKFIHDEPELCGVFGAGIPSLIMLLIAGWV